MTPQKPNIHTLTGTRGCLCLSCTPRGICYYLQPLTFWLCLSQHDPLPYPCLAPEKVKEEWNTVVWLLSVWEEKSSHNVEEAVCRDWHHPHSTLNNTHHNRGTCILLSFLCVSDKSRHTQFTDSILRHSSTVGRLPVSKLNFITPGRRARQTGIYKTHCGGWASKQEKVSSLCVCRPVMGIHGWKNYLSFLYLHPHLPSVLFLLWSNWW